MVQESTCQFRRHRFNPCIGKMPWRRKWQATPVFLPGKSYGPSSLASYTVHRVAKELDRTEQMSMDAVLIVVTSSQGRQKSSVNNTLICTDCRLGKAFVSFLPSAWTSRGDPNGTSCCLHGLPRWLDVPFFDTVHGRSVMCSLLRC